MAATDVVDRILDWLRSWRAADPEEAADAFQDEFPQCEADVITELRGRLEAGDPAFGRFGHAVLSGAGYNGGSPSATAHDVEPATGPYPSDGDEPFDRYGDGDIDAVVVEEGYRDPHKDERQEYEKGEEYEGQRQEVPWEERTDEDGEIYLVDPETGHRVEVDEDGTAHVLDPGRLRHYDADGRLRVELPSGEHYYVDPATGDRVAIDAETGYEVHSDVVHVDQYGFRYEVRYDQNGDPYEVDPASGLRVEVDPQTGYRIFYDEDGEPVRALSAEGYEVRYDERGNETLWRTDYIDHEPVELRVEIDPDTGWGMAYRDGELVKAYLDVPAGGYVDISFNPAGDAFVRGFDGQALRYDARSGHWQALDENGQVTSEYNADLYEIRIDADGSETYWFVGPGAEYRVEYGEDGALYRYDGDGELLGWDYPNGVSARYVDGKIEYRHGDLVLTDYDPQTGVGTGIDGDPTYYDEHGFEVRFDPETGEAQLYDEGMRVVYNEDTGYWDHLRGDAVAYSTNADGYIVRIEDGATRYYDGFDGPEVRYGEDGTRTLYVDGTPVGYVDAQGHRLPLEPDEVGASAAVDPDTGDTVVYDRYGQEVARFDEHGYEVRYQDGERVTYDQHGRTVTIGEDGEVTVELEGYDTPYDDDGHRLYTDAQGDDYYVDDEGHRVYEDPETGHTRVVDVRTGAETIYDENGEPVAPDDFSDESPAEPTLEGLEEAEEGRPAGLADDDFGAGAHDGADAEGGAEELGPEELARLAHASPAPGAEAAGTEADAGPDPWAPDDGDGSDAGLDDAGWDDGDDDFSLRTDTHDDGLGDDGVDDGFDDDGMEAVEG